MVSINYSNSIITNIGNYFFVYLGFFGDLFIGSIISYLDIKNLRKRELWDKSSSKIGNNKKRTFKKITKVILGFFSLMTLILGIFIAYSLLFSPITDFTSWWIGIIFYPFSLSLFLIMLSTTIMLLKLINPIKRSYLRYTIAIIGLIVSTVVLLPFLSTPWVSFQAERNFSDAFGQDWSSKIDSSSKRYFMKTPFTITEYFLGNHPKDCNIDIDEVFYSNTSEGLTLAFDAYYPKVSGGSLPGNNSVIINIHGGAWVAGDKGPMNMLQVNKYFAAQGYVVFDIQYGLKEGGFGIISTPEGMGGNFSIDDQLRHIGNFTKQLNTTKFSKYSLNLNSVFVTGNSAGGHLSLATALLINSGNYSNIFGSHLIIKGIIPLYPGDPPESMIEGRDEFRNPENFFIDENTPPCLLFQGNKDFCLLETKHIKNQYNIAGNNNCCVVWFPFQGHANDLYFSGHFNQYKLYYIERFLYLCVHNKIQ
ncbi:MAG: alpha/beta hydrolase [Promethearchaeia archaeon]